MIRKFSEIFAVTNALKVSLVIHRTSTVYTQQKEGNFPFYVIKLYIHLMRCSDSMMAESGLLELQNFSFLRWRRDCNDGRS